MADDHESWDDPLSVKPKTPSTYKPTTSNAHLSSSSGSGGGGSKLPAASSAMSIPNAAASSGGETATTSSSSGSSSTPRDPLLAPVSSSLMGWRSVDTLLEQVKSPTSTLLARPSSIFGADDDDDDGVNLFDDGAASRKRRVASSVLDDIDDAGISPFSSPARASSTDQLPSIAVKTPSHIAPLPPAHKAAASTSSAPSTPKSSAPLPMPSSSSSSTTPALPPTPPTPAPPIQVQSVAVQSTLPATVDGSSQTPPSFDQSNSTPDHKHHDDGNNTDQPATASTSQSRINELEHQVAQERLQHDQQLQQQARELAQLREQLQRQQHELQTKNRELQAKQVEIEQREQLHKSKEASLEAQVEERVRARLDVALREQQQQQQHQLLASSSSATSSSSEDGSRHTRHTRQRSGSLPSSNAPSISSSHDESHTRIQHTQTLTYYIQQLTESDEGVFQVDVVSQEGTGSSATPDSALLNDDLPVARPASTPAGSSSADGASAAVPTIAVEATATELEKPNARSPVASPRRIAATSASETGASSAPELLQGGNNSGTSWRKKAHASVVVVAGNTDGQEVESLFPTSPRAIDAPEGAGGIPAAASSLSSSLGSSNTKMRKRVTSFLDDNAGVTVTLNIKRKSVTHPSPARPPLFGDDDDDDMSWLKSREDDSKSPAIATDIPTTTGSASSTPAASPAQSSLHPLAEAASAPLTIPQPVSTHPLEFSADTSPLRPELSRALSLSAVVPAQVDDTIGEDIFGSSMSRTLTLARGVQRNSRRGRDTTPISSTLPSAGATSSLVDLRASLGVSRQSLFGDDDSGAKPSAPLPDPLKPSVSDSSVVKNFRQLDIRDNYEGVNDVFADKIPKAVLDAAKETVGLEQQLQLPHKLVTTTEIVDHSTGNTGMVLLFDDVLCWTKDKRLVEPLILEHTWLYSTVVDVVVVEKPKNERPVKRSFFSSKVEEPRAPETRTIKSNALRILTPTQQFELHTSSQADTEYFVSLWSTYVLRILRRSDPNEQSANERLLLYKFDDGSVYDGRWRDAKFWGHGTFMSENGDKYEGDFVNGIKNGTGTLRLHTGEIYEGKWKDGKRHGKGSVVYAGKTLVTKFTGHFENDQMNGPGKVYFSTGDRMSARWENGKPTFPMSMVYERGERYVGQFRVHQTSGAYVREGFGISIYLTGDRYYGMWENDLRAGHGFFVTTCGTEYFGKWEGNLMSGKGSLRFAGDPNWIFYGKVSGDWKSGMCLQTEGAFKWERLPARCDPAQASGAVMRLSTLRGDKWEYFRATLNKGYANGTASRPRAAGIPEPDPLEDKTQQMDKALQKRIADGAEEVFVEVLEILQSKHHVLGKAVHEFASIFAACYDYKHESHSEQLHESAIDDVLSFCNALAGPFLIRLLKVDSIFEEDCSTALKEALMPRIYAPLFSLHSLKFEEKDHKIAQKLKTLSELTLDERMSLCGIDQKHWPKMHELSDRELQATAFDLTPSTEDRPFQAAVSALRQITHCKSPKQKLDCIKDCCTCIENLLKQMLKTFGADELLPMFCLMVMHASPPKLQTESNYIETFLDESMRFNVYGYLLAQLQIAADFIYTLDTSRLGVTTPMNV